MRGLFGNFQVWTNDVSTLPETSRLLSSARSDCHDSDDRADSFPNTKLRENRVQNVVGVDGADQSPQAINGPMQFGSH